MSLPVFSQVNWDGEGGDEQWNNPLNWSGDQLPGPGDEVVLDNSLLDADYLVLLPEFPVTVKRILIAPGQGREIELRLPAANTQVPALTVEGPGYGLIINRGGVFRNASGASSGTPVVISDSIRINNGGRYVHNTPRGHAANVQVLSQSPGTEAGIMELDIPDAATTISLSERCFGKLVLKSAAFGGPLVYTAAGTRPVKIRSELEIGEGVTLSLHFSDTIFVEGRLVQEGGMFNLGNSGRSVVLAVKGDIIQNGGMITETGSANPQILICGEQQQRMVIEGEISQEVSLVKDGPGDLLTGSSITLPFQLVLRQGRIISSPESPLILSADCTIAADSLAAGSYIGGPLCKQGLVSGYFLFPVGKSGRLRWLALEGATGDFTVEYFRGDPQAFASELSEGLHHLSALEYWTISAGGQHPPEAAVRLSFDDPNSGGVTRLEDLRVARLRDGTGTWENEGNSGYGGSPGARGWISGTAGRWEAQDFVFSLASAAAGENPLPLAFLAFRIQQHPSGASLFWQISPDLSIDGFELQESEDNYHFQTIGRVTAQPGILAYSFSLPATGNPKTLYRVLAIGHNESTRYYSRPQALSPTLQTMIRMPTINRDVLKLYIQVEASTSLSFIIHNALGATVKNFFVQAAPGSSQWECSLAHMSPGIYYLSAWSSGKLVFQKRFIRINR